MPNPSLVRPTARARPAQGILHGGHFQMAYATNDLPRARALFAERYGIGEWTVLEGALDQGGHIRVELAWAGPLMYELMFAEGAGSEVYRAVLSNDARFQLRHHHLGYMIHTDADWNTLLDQVEAGGWNMPLKRANPGFLTSCMIEAPELNHFLEFIFPEEAGLTFFNNVARN